MSVADECNIYEPVDTESNQTAKNKSFSQFQPTNINEIKYAVFSGGGAKGATYTGMLSAVCETGIFEGIEAFSGTSAGAITAALMAIGISANKFDEILRAQPFDELLGNLSGKAWFEKDGMPLHTAIHNNINSTTIEYLDTQNLDEQHPCWKLYQQLKNDNHYELTFGDLKRLNQTWPKHFKKLLVTAVRQRDGQLKIFSCDDTPNTPIVLACRASSALPLFLAPVKIDNEYYVDGGVQDNSPVNYFDKNPDGSFCNKYPAQTLVFNFYDATNPNDCSIHQALHGSHYNEYQNQILLALLYKKIGITLEKKLKENTENKPINILIIEAIEEVYDQHEWSFLAPIWIAIIKFFIAIWDWICNLFGQVKSIHERSLEIDDADLTLREGDDYFTVIEKTVLAAARECDPDEPLNIHELIEDALRSLPEDIHYRGPNTPPSLFNVSFFMGLFYNYSLYWLTNIKTDYYITKKFDENFQNIRQKYALQVIPLHVRVVSCVDFKKATKYHRFLSASGYIDTLNNLINYSRYDETQFNPTQFHSNFIEQFTNTFETLIKYSENSSANQTFLDEVQAKETIQEKFHYIREAGQFHPDSDQAFALILATEMRRQKIDKAQMIEEVKNRCGVACFDRSQGPLPANLSDELITFFNSKKLRGTQQLVVATSLQVGS